MNRPFKPEPIVPILADVGVSISDLKRNPAAVIAEARQRQVAILNHNKPVAYIVSPEVWKHLTELHEDILDAELVSARLNEQPVPVSLDDLLD